MILLPAIFGFGAGRFLPRCARQTYINPFQLFKFLTELRSATSPSITICIFSFFPSICSITQLTAFFAKSAIGTLYVVRGGFMYCVINILSYLFVEISWYFPNYYFDVCRICSDISSIILVYSFILANLCLVLQALVGNL